MFDVFGFACAEYKKADKGDFSGAAVIVQKEDEHIYSCHAHQSGSDRRTGDPDFRLIWMSCGESG
jgi:hypothetical protein